VSSAIDPSHSLEEQEADIEATRRRLALEMTELSWRLKPAVVKQRARARLDASVAAFVDRARRRPVLVASVLMAVIGVGVGVGVWKRRNSH